MPELKALLFDVDGTLADTERHGHRIAFNKAFSDANLPWNWGETLYGELLSVTGGKERIKHFIQTKLENTPIDPEDFDTIAGLHKAKTAHYLSMLEKGEIPLRSGVKTLIEQAREAGYTLGIVTTTTPENVTWLLNATLGKESLDWFDVIAAGDIVPAKKPAPDIYDYAMEKLGLNANQCIAFEDSRNGILSSLAADLKTIITVNGYTKDDDFTGAQIVLDKMGDDATPFTCLKGNAAGHTKLDLNAVETYFAQETA